MLQVTLEQLNGWLVSFMYPLARVLGLFAAAPIFSDRATPNRVKLGLGLAISIAISYALPPMPPIDPGSYEGLLILVFQMLIGISIGFVMRLIMAAVDMAGSLIGMQMGLSFAIFFNPDGGGQTAVLTEFLSLLAALIFLAINGHLMMISLVVKSFEWLPVTTEPLSSGGWQFIVQMGTVMFATGFLMSLPMIAALLVANIALGILTRAAPQLNLFAVGFPVTLSLGLVVLALAMNFLGPVLVSYLENSYGHVDTLLHALRGTAGH